MLKHAPEVWHCNDEEWRVYEVLEFAKQAAPHNRREPVVKTRIAHGEAPSIGRRKTAIHGDALASNVV